MTAPAPEGEGAARCMRLALKDAGICADRRRLHQRAWHFDGVQRRQRNHGDQDGIRRASGQACGELDQVDDRSFARRGWRGRRRLFRAALYHGMIPPTINYENPDPDCDLDYVPNKARKADVQVVLVQLFRFWRHQRLRDFSEGRMSAAQRRSVILGTGLRAADEGRDQSRPGKNGRHQRRMDHGAHRNQRAARSRRGQRQCRHGVSGRPASPR